MQVTNTARNQAVIHSARWIFAQAAKSLREAGFSSCHYKIRMPIPISRPMVIDFDSNDSDLMEMNYLGVRERDSGITPSTIDVLARFDRLFAQNTYGRINDIHDATFFLQHKITILSCDINGTLGEMTLMRLIDDQGQACVFASREILEWLVRSVHERIATLLVSNYVPETRVSLTSREREILRWTAEGKTALEIGGLLSISANTVVFHLKNIVAKLGASNKMQAAVKATALGILR